MTHQVAITDEDYAALAEASTRLSVPIEQLVHQAISEQYADSTVESSDSIRYPTGAPLTPEEREEMERIAEEMGSEKPWLSEMVIEDRGPR